MAAHCFLIFREGRQARAAHPEMAHFGGKSVWVANRQFRRWECFCQFSHIIDSERRLLGFQLAFLDGAPDGAQWWRWVECCGNCSYSDGELQVVLTEEDCADRNVDCSCIIGGDVYHDAQGEFLVVIPDLNRWVAAAHDWKIWHSVAFGNAVVDARRSGR